MKTGFRLALPGLVAGGMLLVIFTGLAAPPAALAPHPAEHGSAAPILTSTPPLTWFIYLPLAARPIVTAPMTETRAVWISRYDWTQLNVTPTVTDIQRVVDAAAQAGFNTLLFQVRGAGDAYYTPGLEPWAARLTGSLGATLGQNPGWDPLQALIMRAHAAGLEVHAWLNIYPAWQAPPAGYGPLVPPLEISPPAALNRWTYALNGQGYGLGYTWRVYDRPAADGYMRIEWGQYTWASPAVPQVQTHIAQVAADLAARYDIDGLHLDNVRYPGPQYSLDPFTLAAYQRDPLSATLTITDWRPAFQRAQVTRLVTHITTQTHTLKPTVTVSAAVWPAYARGRDRYYQDSWEWLAHGAIDAAAPMLYSSETITDLQTWTAYAADFQANAGRGLIWLGVGVETSGECVPFEAIAARIQAARAVGAAGQALFSLGAITACGYGDDLRQGPYARPARPQPPYTAKPAASISSATLSSTCPVLMAKSISCRR